MFFNINVIKITLSTVIENFSTRYSLQCCNESRSQFSSKQNTVSVMFTLLDKRKRWA